MNKTIGTSDTRLTALSMQSSCYGACIPWTWGLCQVPANLVWYGGFQAISHTSTQGGKGGVRMQNTTYTYAADVIMDLGYGPITSVTRVWVGKSVYSGGVTGSQLNTVGIVDTLPSSGNMTFNVPAYGNGSSNYATMGSITFNYLANDGTAVDGTMRQGTDYTVSGAGNITIVNPVFHGANIVVYYQYTGSPPATTALGELGLSFIPGQLGQSAWSGLNNYPANQQIGYSGQAQVAATQYPLGTDGTVPNQLFEVCSAWAYHLDSSTPDIDPNHFLTDLLTNTRAGVNWPPQMLDSNTSWSEYCVANDLLISPSLQQQQVAADIVEATAQLTNSEVVWSGGRLKMIPYGDQTASNHGVTYTPNNTPVYALTDDLWVAGDGKGSQGGNKPLGFEIVPANNRFNVVNVEYLDRTQQYSVTTAQAKDLNDIDLNGINTMPTISAHAICYGNIARNVAQLIMQRSLNVLTTWAFTLPGHYVLVEPMDLVTITDTALGLNAWPVRVKTITENQDGSLDITAEDYPDGTCSAPCYGHQALGGYLYDFNAPPGNIDVPVIWGVPQALLPGGVALEIYTAARGVSANWGGCDVWLSMDGNNYAWVDRMYGGSKYGHLTANVASSVSFNNVTSGQFLSATANAAAAMATLCYIQGNSPEYISYQTANLTGNGAYTITGLTRGAYNTTANTHAIGDSITRVDGNIGSTGPLDISCIGQNVHFKFTSFNIYGGAGQSLADVVDYQHYVAPGSFMVIPDPRPLYCADVEQAGNIGQIASAGVFVAQSGQIEGSPGNALNSLWFAPVVQTNAVRGYYVRATVLSGNTPSYGNLNVWTAINPLDAGYSGNGVQWYLTVSGNVPAVQQCQLKIDIATSNSGTPIVSTTTTTLLAQLV